MEVRMSGGPPWGFSLVGGTDFRSPLRIGKVSVNGKAEKAGIAAGYYVLKINGVDCSALKHMEAQRLVKSAKETLELDLAVVELRKKTSQSKMLEPRRTSTSSLPRGMTSFSSYGSRLSYHGDNSATLPSPRTSTSSIGGTDYSHIPAKPAPPPGSRPVSQCASDSIDVGKLTAAGTVIKEPSPVDDVFNKSMEDVKASEDTTLSTTTSTSTIKKPAPPPSVTPKSPVSKPEVAKPVTPPETKPFPQEVTKPVPQEVTKPAPQEETKLVSQAVTKPAPPPAVTKPVEKKQSYKTPFSASATYIPSAPKSEGGSSWYKSMFRSMLANDDEVTIPSETVNPAKQGKVHNAAAAFVAAANENASKSVSPNRHEPSSKTHPSSSFSTSASYKLPPSDATMVTHDDSNDVTNTDTMESMTSEQVRAALRQTVGKTSSATRGWGNVDRDESSHDHSRSHNHSRTTQSNVQGQHPTVIAAEDIQLDKMHPIISDAAISSAPPPPTVHVISPVDDQLTVDDQSAVDDQSPVDDQPPIDDQPPVDDQHVTIATTTATTSSGYEACPSDATMVTSEPSNIDTASMTSQEVKDAIRQTLSGASSNRDWNYEDIKSHAPEGNLQGHDDHVTVTDDIQIDKMHPIISGVISKPLPPIVTEDKPVTVPTTTTTQTRINQSDLPEVKLDTMHPIISEAADATVTEETEEKSTEELMKSTSDELMTALEELNSVIGTSNAVGAIAADHVSLIVKDTNTSDNVSDGGGSHGKGSRSNSRQSDRDGRGSRSSSRQSNTGSHDSRNRKSPPAESGRALYSFSAQNVKELSFKKGDIIKLTRTVDSNWLEGEVDGAKGIFPTSYIELITNISGSNTPSATMTTPEPSVSPVPFTSSTDLPHSIAKFKFQAESSKELSFQKGDILFLSKRVDNNWFKGYNGSGETGIFPCSYVQVVVDLPEEVDYTKSPVEVYPKVEKRPKKQPPPRPSQPPPVKGKKLEENLKPVTTGDHTSSHDPSTVTSFDIPGERYESLFSYEPCNSDELGLEIGDKVVVFEKCDDGWFMGTCERTGEFGAFPGNFVKKLDN